MESGEMDLLSKKAILSLPRDVVKSLDGKILDEYINVKDIEALPTVQSQSTAGQLNDSAQSTNLIDRQQAIDAVRASYDEILDFKSTGRTVADSVEDIISELPSVQPEPQWILCDERMPEEHEWLGTKKFGTTISDEVYVTFENEKGERFCKHLKFQNGELSRYEKVYMETWFKGSKPIAWMPLPKPFEGGTE